MEVIWLRSALADLYEIREYYEARDPKVARDIALHLREAADRLEITPYNAPKWPGSDKYKLVITRYPYIITYRILGEQVQVIWVDHAAQEGRRKNRLKRGDNVS